MAVEVHDLAQPHRTRGRRWVVALTGKRARRARFLGLAWSRPGWHEEGERRFGERPLGAEKTSDFLARRRKSRLLEQGDDDAPFDDDLALLVHTLCLTGCPSIVQPLSKRALEPVEGVELHLVGEEASGVAGAVYLDFG